MAPLACGALILLQGDLVFPCLLFIYLYNQETFLLAAKFEVRLVCCLIPISAAVAIISV